LSWAPFGKSSVARRWLSQPFEKDGTEREPPVVRWCQAAFHSRVSFCLDTYNEAVRAMRYPPDAHKKGLESAEARRERLQQEQELAKHIAEEDEEDF
jgi:hypothetical protein